MPYKTYAYQTMAGEITGGDNCQWIQVNDNQISKKDFLLPNGDIIKPGYIFTKMSGFHTSHLFKPLIMYSGNGMEYIGMIETFDGILLIFHQVPERIDKSGKYRPCYWYNAHEHIELLFYPRTYKAIRVVELTDVIYYKTYKEFINEENCLAKSNT